ncbi:MAG TPA: DUF6152 family protein [Gammaproteobacteria bacterium]
MKTTLKAFAGVMVLSAAVGAARVDAHHSTAGFDTSRVVRIEGTVTQFLWRNPHAAMKIDGDASGDAPDGVWTVEMTAPNVLINQGWKRTSVNAGDKVTLFVNPMRDATFTMQDGSHGGLYVGIILADGSTLGRTDGGGAGTSD